MAGSRKTALMTDARCFECYANVAGEVVVSFSDKRRITTVVLTHEASAYLAQAIAVAEANAKAVR